MKTKTTTILVTMILTLVATSAFLNYKEEKAVDRSKLPEKVELSKGFQRWITNLKNKDYEIDADEFRLIEENEIFNTKWMTIKNLDQEGVQAEYEKIIADKKTDTDKVVFSPSEREFVDYKNTTRDGYKPNEVHFYGLHEDKVIDARFVDCSSTANCYFDRAYFLEDSNDVFVVSEFSRNAPDPEAEPCSIDQLCTYTIKIHVIDILNNSRLVYESEPFEIILANEIQNF